MLGDRDEGCGTSARVTRGFGGGCPGGCPGSTCLLGPGFDDPQHPPDDPVLAMRQPRRPFPRRPGRRLDGEAAWHGPVRPLHEHRPGRCASERQRADEPDAALGVGEHRRIVEASRVLEHGAVGRIERRTVDAEPARDVSAPEHDGWQRGIAPFRREAAVDDLARRRGPAPRRVPLEGVTTDDLGVQFLESSLAISCCEASLSPGLPSRVEHRRNRDDRPDGGEDERERRSGESPESERTDDGRERCKQGKSRARGLRRWGRERER